MLQHSAVSGPGPCVNAAKVLVVSNVRLFREGIATVLTATRLVSVLGAVSQDGLASLCPLNPDAVLVDVQLLKSRFSLGEFRLSSTPVVIGFKVSECAEDILACASSGILQAL